MKLERDSFCHHTLKVAKNLLGQLIIRKLGSKLLIGKIVETEAYLGPNDKASHAYSRKIQNPKLKLRLLRQYLPRIENCLEDKEKFIKKIINCRKCKITKRNLAEYLKGGHIYIYLIYGNYYQLNITTYKEGYPECVLIRSLEPILNLKNPKGPGRLCQELNLDQSFWAEDLCHSSRIWLEKGEKISENQIIKTKRIGIDYAQEYKNKLWRFYIKDNKWVSKK